MAFVGVIYMASLTSTSWWKLWWASFTNYLSCWGSSSYWSCII